MPLSASHWYSLNFSAGAAAGHSPADSTRYYISEFNTVNPGSTTPTGFDVYATADGILRRVLLQVSMLAGTTPSTHLSTCGIVVNDTPSATISDALTMSSVVNVADNDAMAVRIRQGDRLSVQISTPVWSTNPTVVFYRATAWVETSV